MIMQERMAPQYRMVTSQYGKVKVYERKVTVSCVKVTISQGESVNTSQMEIFIIY